MTQLVSVKHSKYRIYDPFISLVWLRIIISLIKIIKYFRIFKHLELNKASDSLYLRFNTHAAGICTLAVKVLLKEAQVEHSVNKLNRNKLV